MYIVLKLIKRINSVEIKQLNISTKDKFGNLFCDVFGGLGLFPGVPYNIQ